MHALSLQGPACCSDLPSGCPAGAILFKETLQQRASDGRSFVQCLTGQGVLPGIKVDEVMGWLHAGPVVLGGPGGKTTWLWS